MPRLPSLAGKKLVAVLTPRRPTSGQAGKPDQNAYIERFNRTYRGDVLDSWIVGSVAELQNISDEWLTDYNENRPHDSLGGIPPAQFLPRPIAREKSSLEVCP